MNKPLKKTLLSWSSGKDNAWERDAPPGSPLNPVNTSAVRRTMLSWSSGKDSAWSLKLLKQDPDLELCGLFTIISSPYERASMHSTRIDLLKLQAERAGLPIEFIEIPSPCSNETYEDIMASFIASTLKQGITHMAFGDLYLEDVRTYRMEKLKGTGITPLFPLWQKPTGKLSEEMLKSGVTAYISSLDPKRIDKSFAGRQWTKELIAELPEGTDPCGENGEFHTIVTNGPFFTKGIDVTVGETVEREGFVFSDIRAK